MLPYKNILLSDHTTIIHGQFNIDTILLSNIVYAFFLFLFFANCSNNVLYSIFFPFDPGPNQDCALNLISLFSLFKIWKWVDVLILILQIDLFPNLLLCISATNVLSQAKVSCFHTFEKLLGFHCWCTCFCSLYYLCLFI